MNGLRFVARFAGLLLLVVAGLLVIALTYSFIGSRARAASKRIWSRILMAISGIDVQVCGPCIDKGAVLLVANHVSWIDIFALNTVRATAFIAKSEIRRWPFLGWLAAGAGTVFIERGRRHAISGVSRAMRERFDAGEAVGLFPEGTTSEGDRLLPFHAGLFESARFLDVPIQPVALIYTHHGRRSAAASFVGEETLLANLWRVLGARGLGVELRFLPVLRIYPTPGAEPATRQEIAHMARSDIGSAISPSRAPGTPGI